MKTALHRLLLTCLLATSVSSLLAQTSMVPDAMNYQGVLTDASGNPVAPTAPENQNVEFRIYSQLAGGSALWGESQTVTVYKGNFSVILGSGTALTGVSSSGPTEFARVFTNATSANLYFGITPQGGPEFAPRQKLLSSAFALRAKTAETVNGSGQPASNPAQFNYATANNLTVGGPLKISGGNVLEFGAGVSPKEVNAGKIGYNAFNTGTLEIFGAGDTASNRKINIYAEGGAEFTGPIKFGNREGQHINLYSDSYAIGIQSSTQYSRVAGDGNFAWFLGGSHVGGVRDPGPGGVVAMHLDSFGLTLDRGKFFGDGSGLTNVPIPNTVNNLTLNGSITKSGHGPFISSFGQGHSFGSQDYTTFERSARNFAWYLGGTWNNNELDAGGGSRIMTLSPGGLTLNNGGFTLDNSSINFGQRLGQHVNLYGTSFGLGIQAGTLYQRTSDQFSWYVGGTHDDNQKNAGGGTMVANWDNSRLDFYKRVYIGANGAAGQAPLEVAGNTLMNPINVAEFWYPGGTGAGYNGRTNFGAFVSINATNAIKGTAFLATSDLRMKLPEGRSDAAKDLETLGALEVTNYIMKDKTLDGGRKHKKLIAQQVEKVFPQAVATTNGVVPDIFRMASAKNGVIAFNEPSEVELKAGDTVRMVQGERDLSTEVTAVTKDGFTVKQSIDEGPLFVYGRKVDDLRTVDYEAIAMLNVSATQELARRLQAQATTVTRLEEENAALKREVAELSTGAERQEKSVAALAAKFEALAADLPPKPVAVVLKASAAR